MKLFGYWRSSATYRIRIVLGLKKIAYTYHPVNLLAGEQSDENYIATNPQRLVPSLQNDAGEIITQSLAIAEYLEDVSPTPSIFADNPVKKARARSIAAAIACEAQPFINLRIQQYLRKDGNFDDDAMQQWIDRWPAKTMQAVDTLIDEADGPFAVGDTPGLADAFIVPQIFAAARFGVDLTACPKMMAVAEACNELQAFKDAHPDNQPDKPA